MIFTDWMKAPIDTSVTVAYLGASLGLPKVIDQYEWTELPENLQLGYYDIIVLNLNSLAGLTLEATAADRLPSASEFARALFWSKTTIIALGNPMAEFYLRLPGDTTEVQKRKVSWWSPLEPSCITGKESRVKTLWDGRPFKVFLDSVDETDWHFNHKQWWVAREDILPISRAIHPLGKRVDCTFHCIARDSNKECVALSTEFILHREDRNAKVSGEVVWLPCPTTARLSESLRVRFKDLNREFAINEDILG